MRGPYLKILYDAQYAKVIAAEGNKEPPGGDGKLYKRIIGFTLIEMLVVIAIIAVIAALLFPVFAQAREKGRQSACLSNTHQLSLAVYAYCQDSDERLPPAAQRGSNNIIVLWPDMIAPYVHNDKVRLCPSDAKAAKNSYGVNELAFRDETDPDNLDVPLNILASFKAPTQTIMLGDIGTGNDLKTDRPDAYKMMPPDQPLQDPADARPSARHQGFANLAFMDGHSKSMRLEQFYSGQTPQDKWFTP